MDIQKAHYQVFRYEFSQSVFIEGSQNGASKEIEEICFVQYFEVLSAGKVTMDKIDKTLRCVRLWWQRTLDVSGNLSPAKECGLVPITSVRGTINLVLENKILSIIDKTKSHSASHFQIYKSRWMGESVFLRESMYQQKY